MTIPESKKRAVLCHNIFVTVLNIEICTYILNRDLFNRQMGPMKSKIQNEKSNLILKSILC